MTPNATQDPPTLRDLLHRSSRTFAIGIDLLPDALRREVTVAYLLLRVSDYLEDNGEIEAPEKVALLGEWDAVLGGEADAGEIVRRLAGAGDPIPDAEVARHARAVLEGLSGLGGDARRIVAGHVRDSTRGMARWVERGPDFATEADLDDYMHEVAGRVGHLLTELFALHFPDMRDRMDERMALAREFGLALQTVNVIRGLHEDRYRGWVYIPRSFLGDRADRTAEIFEPGHAGDAMAVLERLVAKADRHLEAARAYLRRIPRRRHRVRLFCLLPLLFAVRTLAISRANPDVFRRETKMSRHEVRAITRRASILGFSNSWIDWYCRRLGSPAQGLSKPRGEGRSLTSRR